MKRKKHILFFLIIGLSIGIAFSQKINVELFTIENGLSQTSVLCLSQDSKGFIWIGTQDGLNKYDGYSFKIFKNEPHDTTSITNNYIHCITEDSRGNIWVGTNYGLNKLDINTNTFVHYLAEDSNPEKLKENEIYSVIEDSKGLIWIKSINYLSRLNPKTGKFRHYEHYNDVFNFTSVNTKFSILEDKEGNIWVGTKDGLNFFDQKLEIFKRYKHDKLNKSSISNDRVKVIYEDSKNNLWIGTDGGLNKFNKKNQQFTSYLNNPFDSNSLSNNIVNDIFQDNTGDLWIATDNGLNRFNENDESFTAYNEFNFENQTIYITNVSSIIQDKSDIMWVGALQGIAKFERNKKDFKLYDKRNNNSPLFSNNYISSIFLDDDGIMWVGTWGTGLHLFDRKKQEVLKYNTTNSSIGNDFIHEIFKDNKGKIWIGTQNGIYFFNKSTRQFTTFSSDKLINTFKTNRIYDIIQDKDNNYWIGCRNGLHKLVGDSVISYYNNPKDTNTISSNLIYQILRDKDGMLWIATENGLNKLDLKTNKVKRYLKEGYLCKDCISSNEVLCIYEDIIDSCMWFGTVNGLNKFNPQTESFNVYTEKNGLPNNIIYSILQDNSGNLWMSTNRGVSKFNPSNEEFSNFGVSDGLQNYEFNIGAYYKAKDGEILLGGISGINAFYPDSISRNQLVPSIVITGIELLSNKLTQNLQIGNNNTIEIPYKNNLITIEFAALDYTMPEKNNYAYKLEGIEDEWISLGNRRYATFSNLPPGKYVFRVKGSNSDFIWNEEGTSLKIIVKTPIWKETYAYLFYAVFGMLLIFWVIQYRTRSLRKSNQELKEKEQIAKQIAIQKEELTVKNKNITDSIIYAKRIQEALMPSMNLFKRLLSNSFVLYKPKDIVSGDFYWVNERNNKTFIAIVDCTGHGVPGAFMSIIGFELLRNITDDQGVESADQILKDLNKGVATTFGKDTNNVRLKDGMDIALCVIDKKNAVLEYAGAFRPMYFIRDNKIEEIKGDRFSVGLLNESVDGQINKTVIKLNKEDIFYLFSDGYADQFGGPEGKKFKYRRFRHMLLTIHKLPLDQQKIYLEKSLDEWRGDFEQVDDVLIVGFKPELE
ncbi:MAG: hypothetical protein A2X13_06510 [Bacteroidetes bacterium GWC2_33_15]|nr:MAG: hypothetical protein A2X10_03405 [Bacteroidetes bacterium GWA2_33_15]OFX52434.1 MAG: hypothetical protein A2X13_06510 [Bacteroidetes bacterium GWC2_33_15]OFX65496.1 MAG: hypothetical protein A2X15_14625 [Bacteroidetes bacterium GWB2_32_14]OFX67515.1 MAG: hypothetical protein A2X14_11340 [Bacteroidetes bacterium GWD2_33_33]HAN18443.1 hypothetical protein [Bacteroidales bacterium]